MDMSLALLFALPVVGGGLCALLRLGEMPSRLLAMASLLVTLLVLVIAWASAAPVAGSPWLLNLQAAWIPDFGISFHLAADGISLVMVALTLVLAAAGIVLTGNECREQAGLFYASTLWITAGVCGVFLAVDMFLFFFFWELMLIPLYLLVGMWGKSERRVSAAIKMLIYTQASGLCMLLAILFMVFSYHAQTGRYSFDYLDLLNVQLSPLAGLLAMAGFGLAFAVKLPVLPLHGWVMDVFEESPTGAIYTGLMLKTGAYGLLRFGIPLLPEAAQTISHCAMILGAVTVVYGMVVALAQTDIKRMVAYISISHMGLALVGLFAWNELALQGVVMIMVAHGLGLAALFGVTSMLEQRLGTRDLAAMGGLWKAAPRLGAGGMVVALAALGLPGFGTFIGEILVLLGAWQVNVWATIIAATGMVGSAIYALYLVQYTFQGKVPERGIADVNVVETGSLLLISVPVIILGFYPQPLLDITAPAVSHLLHWSGLN